MFARLRACLLATFVLSLGACDGADRLTDPSSDPIGVAAVDPVSFSNDDDDDGSSRGGIPIGTYAQPTSEFGSRYTGGLRNIYPNELLKELAAIKARGGKVVLMFAGYEGHYKGKDGHFNLGMWKARIDRYKGTNFSSYVNDGTVIAHYLIDEPNDAFNWNGKPVSASVLEEMAEYSKRLWPNMTTVVRAEPGYLGTNHRHLDAAWAQYVERKGTAADYLRRNVAEAEKKGLGLIVGINILKGTLSKSPFSGAKLKEAGSTLMSGSYPCAFISWEYDAQYMARSDVKEAMQFLAEKARTRQAKSCRGGKSQTPEPTEPPAPAPPAPPAPSAPPAPPAPPETPTSAIKLTVIRWTAKNLDYMRLTWSGAKGSTVDVIRDGRLRNTPNDGKYTNTLRSRPGFNHTYKVCEKGASKCSTRVTAFSK